MRWLNSLFLFYIPFLLPRHLVQILHFIFSCTSFILAGRVPCIGFLISALFFTPRQTSPHALPDVVQYYLSSHMIYALQMRLKIYRALHCNLHLHTALRHNPSKTRPFMWYVPINLWTPNSDQWLISPYSSTAQSNMKVVRENEVINK